VEATIRVLVQRTVVRAFGVIVSAHTCASLCSRGLSKRYSRSVHDLDTRKAAPKRMPGARARKFYIPAVVQRRVVLLQSMDVSRLFDRTLPLCQYRHSVGRMKKLAWLADSRANVRSFPAGVRDEVGYALYAAQYWAK
jgi:hypothetical protein